MQSASNSSLLGIPWYQGILQGIAPSSPISSCLEPPKFPSCRNLKLSLRSRCVPGPGNSSCTIRELHITISEP